jgi:tetratricopeptide (TPR) repeat protein
METSPAVLLMPAIHSVRALIAAGIFFSCSFFSSAQSAGAQQQIQAHLTRARQLLAAGQPGPALEEYKAILAIEPKNVDAHANAGTVLFFQGEYKGAIPELQAAIKLRPDLWKAQALLGMSEKRAGQAAEARKDLEKAFAHLDEEKVRVQTGLELMDLYYASGDLAQAAAVVNVLRQLRPTDVDIVYAAEKIYSDLEDESKLTLMMLAPHSARMEELTARELLRQGDTKAAIEHYREAIRLAPRLSGLHFELAEALNASNAPGGTEEVAKEYEAALADNPFDAKSECRLGELAFRQSDLKSAYAHFERALQLAPDDADANLGLGKTLVSMHEPQKARQLLERAAQLEPFNAVVHFRLAAAYRQSGRMQDASRELAEFQKLKTMKENLQKVYRESGMRKADERPADPDVPK